MEEEEKMRNIFEKYDDNKNGVLDRNEFFKVFKDLLKSLGENFPTKKHDQVAEEAIENFDQNKNGVIEFSEFCELMNFLIYEKGYKL